MSIILRRPYLIDESSCTVDLPSPTFDADARHSDIPSPIVDQIFRYKAAKITMEIVALENKTEAVTVRVLLQKLHQLHDSLPEPLKAGYSSFSVDKKSPRLGFARYKVTLDIYISIFMLLKPFILLDVRGLLDAVHDNKDVSEFRTMACDYGLRIIDMVSDMEALFIPQRAKDNQLAFTPFDIAMALCVALQRDGKRTLPMRKQVLMRIGTALRTLSRMEKYSRVSRDGCRVLNELVSNLSLASDEKSIIFAESSQQQRDESQLYQPDDLTTVPSLDTADNLDEVSPPPTDNISTDAINEYLPPVDEDLDLFTQSLAIDWQNNIDLGILDNQFHWDSIFLDEFRDSDIQE